LLIATAGVSDRLVTIRKLAKAYGVHPDLSHPLHKDLNLSKKSARWVSKLLNHDMKKEQVRTSEEFLPMVRSHFMSLLDNIINMDGLTVPIHTPKTWQQSNSGWRRASLVSATRKKQIVRAFFDSKDLIYTNYVTGENSQCLVHHWALSKFLRFLKQTRPVQLTFSLESFKASLDCMTRESIISTI
jgi:hypothetical protein